MWQSPPMKLILASMASIIAAPGLAMSGPVNLKCVLDDQGKQVPLEISLNEAIGTVTYGRPDTGSSRTAPGDFLPERVMFGPFTLSRTSMQISRYNYDSSMRMLGLPRETVGKCEILEVKRVF